MDVNAWEPGYLRLAANNRLSARVAEAVQRLEQCEICPRRCRKNRLQGEVGLCRTGRRAVVASFSPHFGEEAPLVGRRGSGTIFFTHCNLYCLFCQNYEISHQGQGELVEAETLAGIMLRLQEYGCHNINFVTPTHVTPQILEAVELAAQRGLKVPLVYNCGGYESLETLKLLEGVFDIYMPDIKSFDVEKCRRYFKAEDYPEVVKKAIKEMYRQVGDLELKGGLATRGLLVRHLVMPQAEADSAGIMRFLAEEISPHTYVNIMDQYHPCGGAYAHAELRRGISTAEYSAAIAAAEEAGLTRLDERAASRKLRF